MTSKAPVHVEPREDGWAVIREGNERATSRHPTQAKAAKEGRKIARRDETKFFLHAQDGRIREHSNYGEAKDVDKGDEVSQGQQNQQGPLGGVTDQVGQVTQGVQDTAGQAVGQVGQTVEGLAPGTQLLGEPTTNEQGQTVQRTVDEAGNIVENTLDESGGLLDETPVGSVTDLPAEEEYQTEEGQTIRTVKDESGTLIQLQLGPDGSLLNLQIPPPTETEETTEESQVQETQPQQGAEGQEGGPQDLAQQIQEQTVQSAQDFFGESLGRIKGQLQSGRAELESLAEQVPQEDAKAQIQEMVDSYSELENSLDQAAQDLGIEDTVNQALQQAQEAVGQVAGQAQAAAGGAAQQAQDTAGRAVQGAQEAAGGAAQQAQQAQEEEPEVTEAAKQKAEELGVDLSQVEGTGAEGRITVKDVRDAANQS